MPLRGDGQTKGMRDKVGRRGTSHANEPSMKGDDVKGDASLGQTLRPRFYRSGSKAELSPTRPTLAIAPEVTLKGREVMQLA